MQLSYSSSVIKASNAKQNGQVIIKAREEAESQEPTKAAVFFEEEYKNYQSLANSILAKSKKDREEILEKAYKDAAVIEQEAYKRGYELGKKEGYDQGYKESYEKHIEMAMAKEKEIVDNATELLLSAKSIYERYLMEKEESIVSLAVRIAENAIHESLEDHKGLNTLVQEALEASKNAKSYVIRCHEKHIKELEATLEEMKTSLALKGEIFLLEDKSLAPGNAVIEKDNGRVELGIDIALKKLREEFKE